MIKWCCRMGHLNWGYFGGLFAVADIRSMLEESQFLLTSNLSWNLDKVQALFNVPALGKAPTRLKTYFSIQGSTAYLDVNFHVAFKNTRKVSMIRTGKSSIGFRLKRLKNLSKCFSNPFFICLDFPHRNQWMFWRWDTILVANWVSQLQ